MRKYFVTLFSIFMNIIIPECLDSKTVSDVTISVQKQVVRHCPLQSSSAFLYEIIRRQLPNKVELHCCNAPESTYDYLKAIGMPYQTQEVMLTLVLNTKNRVVGHYVVSRGLVDRAHVQPREIFRIALMSGASKIILAHNHPSGDPNPSSQDIASNNNLVKAGKILGVKVVDHIVV